MFDQERLDAAIITLQEVQTKLASLSEEINLLDGVSASKLRSALLEILEHHDTYVLVSKSIAGQYHRGLADLNSELAVIKAGIAKCLAASGGTQ